MAERWNSNLHALGRLLVCVPQDAERGLDVGCGEGETSRRLRTRVTTVVGLDPDVDSVELARSYVDDIVYIVGDLLTADLPQASFDVVLAVAVIHHLDHRAALERLATLVQPGGLLLVVGLACSRSIPDLLRDAFDSIAIRRRTLHSQVWETPAPKCWPPPLSYSQVRQTANEVLPGMHFERLPYFRYGITWSPPANSNAPACPSRIR